MREWDNHRCRLPTERSHRYCFRLPPRHSAPQSASCLPCRLLYCPAEKCINVALRFMPSAESISFKLSVYGYPVGIHILLLIIPAVVSVVVTCRHNKCKIMKIIKANGEPSGGVEKIIIREIDAVRWIGMLSAVHSIVTPCLKPTSVSIMPTLLTCYFGTHINRCTKHENQKQKSSCQNRSQGMIFISCSMKPPHKDASSEQFYNIGPTV